MTTTTISEAQLAANRANALKSTGPKDCTTTKFNGIKHGLTATHALLPWEHAEDLQSIVEAFEHRWKARDNYELIMIRNAAENFWRMTRGTRMETNMLEVLANNEIQSSGHKPQELHAGHLETIGFMKGRHTVEHFRRYDAHLQRTFEKSLKRVQEMASLRTKEQREA